MSVILVKTKTLKKKMLKIKKKILSNKKAAIKGEIKTTKY